MIVGGLAACHVDGDSLGRHGIPASRLAYAEDHIGVVPVCGIQHRPGGKAEDRGDLELRQAVIGNVVREPGHGLPGGVDGLAAEGVETGDDEVLHGPSLLSIFVHIITKLLQKQENAQ